jgi:hypothetical protein
MRDFTAKLLTLCRIISGIDGEKINISGEVETPTELLIEQLQYHQLIPLVYYYWPQLQEAGWNFDQDTIELLRSHTFSNISRMMIVEHFLQHLDGLFKANAVEYRVFKGIVTAKSVYQEDYLRSFGDVDILVRADQLQAVESLLQQEGFIHAEDLYSHFPDEIIQKYSFAQHFNRAQPYNVSLDVHLNLSGRLHPFQFDSAEFWHNHTAIAIDGSTILTFDRAYQAVYAIYHAFKHYFFKLIWFIDAFLLLDQEQLDPAKFQQLIEKYKLSRLLVFYSQITLNLFGRLPRAIKQLPVTSKRPHRIINAQTVLRGSLPYSHSRVRILLPMYYLPGLFARMRFLWTQLFPPIETVRDFYLEDGPRKRFWSYVKLRSRAISDLMLNRRWEEQ